MYRARRTIVLSLIGVTASFLPSCDCGPGNELSPIPTSKLVFTGQPSNTAVGAHINPAVSVAAEVDGGVDTGFTSTISVKLDGGPGGATLAGTLTVTPVQGVATFSDLSIDTAGTYELIATSSDFYFTAATSSTFNASSGTHAISGTVSGAVSAGVTMQLTGASSATTTTGTGGAYNFGGLASGSYTVTPSLGGYTFSPSDRSVTVAGSDVTGQDFTASHVATTQHIYLTDGLDNAVIRMDDFNGTNWTSLRDAGTNAFVRVFGIYVDPSDTIYVTGGGEVVQTTLSGTPWNVLGHNAANTDRFFGPEGVAVDAAGKVYVTDWAFLPDGGNVGRVVQTDMSGTTWNTVGTYGSGTGQLACPGMLYVDSSSPPFLYIADRCNDRIVQTTMSGTPWNVLTGKAGGGDTFHGPRGIAAAPDGGFWVADESNGRIVFTTMSGVPWTSEVPPLRPDGGAGPPPTALFVDSTGLVYSVSYQGQGALLRFDPSTSAWTGFSGEPAGQTSQFYGVYVR